jgi:hypothetical protein
MISLIEPEIITVKPDMASAIYEEFWAVSPGGTEIISNPLASVLRLRFHPFKPTGWFRGVAATTLGFYP